MEESHKNLSNSKNNMDNILNKKKNIEERDEQNSGRENLENTYSTMNNAYIFEKEAISENIHGSNRPTVLDIDFLLENSSYMRETTELHNRSNTHNQNSSNLHSGRNDYSTIDVIQKEIPQNRNGRKTGAYPDEMMHRQEYPGHGFLNRGQKWNISEKRSLSDRIPERGFFDMRSQYPDREEGYCMERHSNMDEISSKIKDNKYKEWDNKNGRYEEGKTQEYQYIEGIARRYGRSSYDEMSDGRYRGKKHHQIYESQDEIYDGRRINEQLMGSPIGYEMYQKVGSQERIPIYRDSKPVEMERRYQMHKNPCMKNIKGVMKDTSMMDGNMEKSPIAKKERMKYMYNEEEKRMDMEYYNGARSTDYQNELFFRENEKKMERYSRNIQNNPDLPDPNSKRGFWTAGSYFQWLDETGTYQDQMYKEHILHGFEKKEPPYSTPQMAREKINEYHHREGEEKFQYSPYWYRNYVRERHKGTPEALSEKRGSIDPPPQYIRSKTPNMNSYDPYMNITNEKSVCRKPRAGYRHEMEDYSDSMDKKWKEQNINTRPIAGQIPQEYKNIMNKYRYVEEYERPKMNYANKYSERDVENSGKIQDSSSKSFIEEATEEKLESILSTHLDPIDESKPLKRQRGRPSLVSTILQSKMDFELTQENNKKITRSIGRGRPRKNMQYMNMSKKNGIEMKLSSSVESGMDYQIINGIGNNNGLRRENIEFSESKRKKKKKNTSIDSSRHNKNEIKLKKGAENYKEKQKEKMNKKYLRQKMKIHKNNENKKNSLQKVLNVYNGKDIVDLERKDISEYVKNLKWDKETTEYFLGYMDSVVHDLLLNTFGNLYRKNKSSKLCIDDIKIEAAKRDIKPNILNKKTVE